jgi:polyphosphate kinase
MNALVDADVVEALYRASQAGVPITLLVRGICCLRPGVPHVSENIEVRAIVDRYLEHGRIFHFTNGGKDDVYVSSADWMPRNFHRRVEVMVPVEDATLRARLIEILTISVNDNVKSWRLGSDGSYARVVARPGAPLLRSQARFIEATRDKLKGAEAAGAASGRFHLMHTRPRLDAASRQTPRRREGRKSKEP